MKAFVLAAGLGTRLGYLTNNKPKALVEYREKTLLQWVIEKLKNEGFTQIIINIHHFGEQIIQFIEANNSFGLNIYFSDERAMLLDTGGAILHASHLLSDTSDILIYNVDILSNISLEKLVNYHLRNNALATLSLSKRNSSRQLLFNTNFELKAWKNIQTNQIKGKYSEGLDAFSFNGIHIISNQIFRQITESGKFSIIDLYLRLAENQSILGYYTPEYYFRDMGKLADLME